MQLTAATEKTLTALSDEADGMAEVAADDGEQDRKEKLESITCLLDSYEGPLPAVIEVPDDLKDVLEAVIENAVDTRTDITKDDVSLAP